MILFMIPPDFFKTEVFIINTLLVAIEKKGTQRHKTFAYLEKEICAGRNKSASRLRRATLHPHRLPNLTQNPYRLVNAVNALDTQTQRVFHFL